MQVTDSNYTVLDDTAVDVAGGFVRITGTNFVAGCQVMVDMTVVSTVTFVSATEVRAQLAARAAGTYTVYVINPNGDTAVRIYGVTFSAVPAWVTGSTLTGDSGTAVSIQLAATGASTYSLQAGSTLPPGLSLNSAGLLSGTVNINEETLYNFTVLATDAELQDSPRSFAITITAGDQQIAYVTTLLNPELSILPFNRDASTNNFAVSLAGDTRPNNFGPYTPGYYSNFFDGNGDNLLINYNAALHLLTDFTIECWFYANAHGGMILNFAGGLNIAWASYEFVSNSDGINFAGSSANNGYDIGSETGATGRIGTIQLGTWNHLAVTRSGNVYRGFVNGVQGYTQTLALTPYNPNARGLVIGGNYANTWASGTPTAVVNGYISNLRIINGTAVYTTNFTPPAQPLTNITNTSLLTCQSNRFIDNSTNNFAIIRNGDTRINGLDPFVIPQEFAGRGSTFFDGSGDSLTVPPGTPTYLSSDLFTIEAWVYPNANNGVIVGRRAAVSARGFFLAYLDSNRFGFWAGDTDVNFWNLQLNSTNTFPLNQWYHVAATRSSGNVFTLWVNGVSEATGTSNFAIADDTSNLQIGIVDTSGSPFNGYISNLRIVKNTALYTANFTPPTQPLTAIANTSLLTCQTNQPQNNNQFLDSSTNNLFVTRFGNTTQGSFSPYGGGWSNYFDGTGDYLSVPSNAAFNFESGNFTIETWINIQARPGSGVYPGIVSSRTGFTTSHAWSLYLSGDSNGAVTLNVSTSGGAPNLVIEIVSNPVLGTWYHVAVSRVGNIIYTSRDGVVTSTAYSNSIHSSSSTLNIGRLESGSTTNAFTGHISNLRIVKGTGLYTANFTPPVAPLRPIAGTSLLTCCDNRLIDDSANNFAVTRTGDVRVEKFNPFGIQTAMTPLSHSAFFDGTDDFLTGPSNAAFAFGTEDFTIEAWVNTTTLNSVVFDNRTVNEPGVFFIHQTTGRIGYFDPTVTSISGSTTNCANGSWNHLAWCRSGSTFRMFVNGGQEYSGTLTSNFGTTRPARIGSSFENTAPFNGCISNLRIVKGTAVYTTNFTPPTQPLTAVANTSLLTCQSPTFVDNSTNRFAITANGNAQPLPVNPFGFTSGTRTNYTPTVFGGSISFDGTGDYLTVAGNSTLALGAGDFTVEGWFYATTTAFWRALVLIGNGSTEGVYLSSANTLAWFEGGGRSASAVVTANQWNHFAVTRSGSTLRVFLNGVKSASDYATVTDYTRTSVRIGANADTSEFFTGHLSNIRVIKGRAVYTSNFVPPTEPLAPVANTTLLVNGTAAAVYDASMSNNLETVGDARISTAVVKYGTTSMIFDGTGDSLTLSNVVSIGTGNFTIEGWFWLGAIGNAYYSLFNSGAFGIRYGDNGFANRLQFGYDLNTFGSIYSCVIQSGNNFNQWAHVAWTRSNGINRLFFNGAQQNLGTGINPATYPEASFTNSSNPPAGGNIGSGWLGYIQDFRITRGVARYTTTFTPPAAALRTR